MRSLTGEIFPDTLFGICFFKSFQFSVKLYKTSCLVSVFQIVSAFCFPWNCMKTVVISIEVHKYSNIQNSSLIQLLLNIMLEHITSYNVPFWKSLNSRMNSIKLCSIHGCRIFSLFFFRSIFPLKRCWRIDSFALKLAF